MIKSIRALVTAAVLFGAAGAEADVFHDNTGPTPFQGPFSSGDEIADDVRFAGAQTVTSFSIMYHADAPVNATFRFSTVNASTGRPGATVATFTATNLAAGDHVFTMNLSASQRFTWNATPGIYRFATETGGFFSVRFTTPTGGNAGRTAGWVRASGRSLDGFVDVTTNEFITFQGDTAASFYLQVSNNAAAGAPQLNSLRVSPIDVVGGATSDGVVTISQPAPAGGVVIDLDTSDPAVVSIPATVTVLAGQTSAEFDVVTSPVSADTAVEVVATLGAIVRGEVMSIHTAAPPADRVTITQAEFRSSRRQLRVQATSTSASATLTAFVTSTGAQIGTLSNNGGGQFRGEFTLSTNPQNITVRSSAGGSATAAVTAR